MPFKNREDYNAYMRKYRKKNPEKAHDYRKRKKEQLKQENANFINEIMGLTRENAELDRNNRFFKLIKTQVEVYGAPIQNRDTRLIVQNREYALTVEPLKIDKVTQKNE